MSNYKSHSVFNCLIALPIFALFAYKFLHPETRHLFIFSGVFLYATLFMSPDVDLAKKIKLFSIRGFFTLPFRSYSKIFKHRGISHSLFFGTLTRILWLCLWGFALAFLLDYAIEKKPIVEFVLSYKLEFLWGFSAIFLADLCHLVLDKKKA